VHEETKEWRDHTCQRSTWNGEHVFEGLEAYLIEFCQFDPKQLSRIVNKEQQGSCIY